MKTFFISLLLLLIHYVAAAQQVNIEEIKSSKFKGVKAIEGKGYYLIYQTEDAEGKNKKFEVQTFDHDLKLIKKFELILPKGSEASGGEFNGVNFVLTFTNDKENQIDLMSYTPDGVLAGKKTLEIDDINFTDPFATPRLFSADTSGFYFLYHKHEDKWGYKLYKLNNKLKTVWTHGHSPETGMETIADAKLQNKKVILLKLYREKLTGKKFLNSLLCLNDSTGKKLFEYKLYDDKNDYFPTEVAIDPEGNAVTSGMYFEGSRINGNSSDGIFFIRLDSDGKELVKKNYAWDGKTDQFVKESAKGGGLSVMKPTVIFMDIIIKPDGNILTIAQPFKYASDANSIGANVGNRLLNTYVNGSSKAAEDIIKLVLNGILLFEFSHDGELVSMDHIETGPTGIYLSASDVSSPISVGFLLKRMGIRNYAYWDPGANPDEISLIFLASKKGESPYIGIENIGAGKMKETKVPLDEIDHIAGDDGLDFENKSVSVIRSKPGYVCFYTYSKKEKTVMIKVKKV